MDAKAEQCFVATGAYARADIADEHTARFLELVEEAGIMLPKRIQKAPKPDKRFRSPAHCNFVRSHACSACGSMAGIEVAHVRTGTDGGMGMKPGDYWTLSLCHACHAAQHSIGEQTFEQFHGIDLKGMAREFVKASPKRRELEMARDKA